MLPKIENKVVKTFIEHSSSYHKDNMPSQIRNTFIFILKKEYVICNSSFLFYLVGRK